MSDGGGSMRDRVVEKAGLFNALRTIIYFFSGVAALWFLEKPNPGIFHALFIFSVTVCFDCYAYYNRLPNKSKMRIAICTCIIIYVIIAGSSEALAKATTIRCPDASRINYYVIELNKAIPWCGGAQLDYLCLIIGGLAVFTFPAIMTWILDKIIEKSAGNEFAENYEKNRGENTPHAMPVFRENQGGQNV